MDCVNYKVCNNKNLEPKQFYVCDKCSRVQCKTCSEVSSTEIRVLELNKRKLKYYCPECCEDSDKTLQQNKHLVEENARLKNQLCELTNITKKLEHLEHTFNKSQKTYTQALTEINQNISELKSNQHNEHKHLQNQIKVLRDSNVDLVNLLTNNKDNLIWNTESIRKESQPGPSITLTPATNNDQNITQDDGVTKKKTYKSALTANLSLTPVFNTRVTPTTVIDNNLQKSTNRIDSSSSHLLPATDNNTKDQSKNFEGFREVRRRRMQLKVGNGEGDNIFHGREGNANRKIWLFISRVPDSISDDNIKQYIEKRTSSSDIYIKKLPTLNARQDNQSFMVGVDPEFQNAVYDPSFWPKKVIYGRFDFKMGRRFLDNPRQSNISSNSQVNSFFAQQNNLPRT